MAHNTAALIVAAFLRHVSMCYTGLSGAMPPGPHACAKGPAFSSDTLDMGLPRSGVPLPGLLYRQHDGAFPGRDALAA
jgi:hypothetical protein